MNEPERESTDPIIYVIHEDHLHSPGTIAEAKVEAKQFGSEIYPSGEVVAALLERPLVTKIIGNLAGLLMKHIRNPINPGPKGGCRCETCALLGNDVHDLSLKIQDIFKSGILDEAMSPAKHIQMATQIYQSDLMKSLRNFQGRKVRVIAARPEEGGIDVAALVGREFDVMGANADGDRCIIAAPEGFEADPRVAEKFGLSPEEGKGLVLLNPDEWVFADEINSPAQPAQ